MPRDGSNIYSQPFPDVAAGTEIESAVYNGFVSDIALDLNTARPIIAGGTGSTNAPQALGSLGAERSGDVVTNYDSHIFYAGSFSSASGATGGPVAGHAFAGIAYDSDAIGAAPDYVPLNQNVIIEVRDQDDTVTPGRKYVREKKAGAWSSWYADGFQVFGGNVGISSSGADMFAGFSSTPQAFIVNTESDVTGTDALKVGKSGDVTVRAADGGAYLALAKSGSGKINDISAYSGSTLRWVMRMGNEVAESGSNAGSNFHLYRVDDAGTGFTAALSIVRSSGATSLHGPVTADAGINVAGGTFSVSGAATFHGGASFPGGVTGNTTSTGSVEAPQLIGNSTGSAWQLQLRDSATNWKKYLRTTSVGSFEIVNNAFSAVLMVLADDGALHSQNTIYANGSASQNQLRIRNSLYSIVHRNDNSSYYFLLTNSGDTDGTWNSLRPFRIDLTNGNVTMDHTVTTGNLTCNGSIFQTAGAGTSVHSNGYACKPGVSGAFRPNYFVIDYSGNAGLYIDTTFLGLFQYVSDYRTKKDVVELPSAWDKVKALRPVKYTQKEFSPPSHYEFRAQQKAQAEKTAKEGGTPEPVSDAPFVPNDDTEMWGFIAHELQETLTPSAASSAKDAPDAIQAPNPWTMLAAVTKALQEAMTRIETLEARVGELESVA